MTGPLAPARGGPDVGGMTDVGALPAAARGLRARAFCTTLGYALPRFPGAWAVPAHLGENAMGKILVVDDQRNMRTTLAMMLRGVGYEVDEAADGAQGRESGAAGAFDVVITDLRMGEYDGIDVLRAVKTSPALAAIPVVVLTTSSNAQDLARAYECNVNSFLVKPDDFASLNALIADLGQYWLDLNRQPAEHCAR